MVPFEHALLAVDAQPDVVLAARGRLRHRERAAHVAFEFHQRGDVVDDLAPRQQRADVGRDTRATCAARHERREMLRVAADGAHHQREAAALGIEDPAKAIVLRTILHARRHAGLDVFDLHQPQRGPSAPSRTSCAA